MRTHRAVCPSLCPPDAVLPGGGSGSWWGHGGGRQELQETACSARSTRARKDAEISRTAPSSSSAPHPSSLQAAPQRPATARRCGASNRPGWRRRRHRHQQSGRTSCYRTPPLPVSTSWVQFLKSTLKVGVVRGSTVKAGHRPALGGQTRLKVTWFWKSDLTTRGG